MSTTVVAGACWPIAAAMQHYLVHLIIRYPSMELEQQATDPIGIG